MEPVIDTMRHRSVFDPAEFNFPMHVIGAGATGSRVFAALIELGMKRINVYDYDTVESHNIANQIYTAEDIGGLKINGCARFAKRKVGSGNILPAGINVRECKVTREYINSHSWDGVVFLLTDTMQSRREIFDALAARCIELNGPNSTGGQMRRVPLLIIETRMGSTHGSVFTVNPFDSNQCEQWRSTLVDDEDEDAIELSPCGTALSVGTTASLIANYAVWQMMQFFVDPVGMQPRIDFYFKPTLTIASSALAA